MYLVIDTINEVTEFTHFINLEKTQIKKEIEDFIEHLYAYQNQKVTKVYYSKDRLSNW